MRSGTTRGLRHSHPVSIPESVGRYAIPPFERGMERRRFRIAYQVRISATFVFPSKRGDSARTRSDVGFTTESVMRQGRMLNQQHFDLDHGTSEVPIAQIEFAAGTGGRGHQSCLDCEWNTYVDDRAARAYRCSRGSGASVALQRRLTGQQSLRAGPRHRRHGSLRFLS
jgi:hypothetical protein